MANDRIGLISWVMSAVRELQLCCFNIYGQTSLSSLMYYFFITGCMPGGINTHMLVEATPLWKRDLLFLFLLFHDRPGLSHMYYCIPSHRQIHFNYMMIAMAHQNFYAYISLISVFLSVCAVRLWNFLGRRQIDLCYYWICVYITSLMLDVPCP